MKNRTKEVLRRELVSVDYQIERLKALLRSDAREVEDSGQSIQGTTDQNNLSSQLEVLTQQRHALDAALHAAKHGICITCDKPISEARLKARPESDTCIDCARGRESHLRNTARRVPRFITR